MARRPAINVARNSTWKLNSKTNILNVTRSRLREREDFRRSLGGPIGKPAATTSCSSSFNLEYNPRHEGRRGRQLSHGQACWSGQATFPRTLEQQRNPFPYIKTRSSRHLLGREHHGVLQGRRILGKIPANRLYETGV